MVTASVKHDDLNSLTLNVTLVDCGHVSLPNSLSFDPVDGDEISSIMRKFKKHKASDPISVPTDILHYLNYDFARPLSWITNISFSTGIHPR